MFGSASGDLLKNYAEINPGGGRWRRLCRPQAVEAAWPIWVRQTGLRSGVLRNLVCAER